MVSFVVQKLLNLIRSHLKIFAFIYFALGIDTATIYVKECFACVLFRIFMVSHITFWRRKWQPTPVFLPGESHGQRSLMGCSPWGHTESDTTEATWQQHITFRSLIHFEFISVYGMRKCSNFILLYVAAQFSKNLEI